MKKLVLKIIVLMLFVMGVVLGLSQLILYIIRTQSIIIDSTTSYLVSLGSGFLGLIIFFVLLDAFVFKRIKKLSDAVKKVSTGQLDVQLNSRNIDEIDDLIKNFNSMVKQLHSNEYLSQEFIRNVSHEFKNPLATIIGYIELLKNDKHQLNQDQLATLEILYNQAKHLENMSQQMLMISRLDASDVQPTLVMFKPSKQIKEIILSMQTNWSTKQLTWDLIIDDVEIKSAPEWCYIIWKNLISNAIKFANSQSQITIDLKINQHLTFSITNVGPAITKKEQTLIFKQFYTNKNQYNHDGSGLGLPLVKKIITKLNGSISLTSDESKTTFIVVLENNYII